MNSQEILVHIDLNGSPHRVGKLWCHNRKGRESASFEYDSSWLKHRERFALEPALQLTPGAFHTRVGQTFFGSIGDSAPDRWGRVLMRRAEAMRAKLAGETPRTLGEVDFLMGVEDQTRQGSLRFSKASEGPFLSQNGKRAIPLLIDLPTLLSATERLIDNEENAEDLRLLLAPGSSLGGARPKASVRDSDGHLSIAKFPRKDDEFNVVIWEAVVLDLAKKAGINVSTWQLETILEKPVLIVRRFDRLKDQRLPFLSAMSMLGATDHEVHSYLEIVQALQQHGSNPDVDLAELWRRIVFTILVSNTDDHLRNHGFLYEQEKGWRLSPAYDINPTPTEIKPRVLTTMIDLFDNTASLELALSVANDFRLSPNKAKEMVREVAMAVATWREVAQGFDLKKHEIDRMASAFEHVDLRKALVI